MCPVSFPRLAKGVPGDKWHVASLQTATSSYPHWSSEEILYI